MISRKSKGLTCLCKESVDAAFSDRLPFAIDRHKNEALEKIGLEVMFLFNKLFF